MLKWQQQKQCYLKQCLSTWRTASIKDAGADELVKAGTALGSLMENEVVNIVVTEKAEVAEAE